MENHSVLELADIWLPKRTKIVKPGTADISPLCYEESDDSPAAKGVLIRGLTLYSGCVTPAHKHLSGVKVYSLTWGGAVQIFQLIRGQWRMYILKSSCNGIIAVPAGIVHAVYCIRNAGLYVIRTSDDPNDIIWEFNADELNGCSII